MKLQLVGAVLMCMLSACGGSDSDGGGAAGAGGQAGSSGGGGSGGSGGASGGSGGAAGSAGAAADCGDSVINGTEQCDGLQFGTASCESLGAGPGALTCDGISCKLLLWNCGCGGEAIATLPATLQGETQPALDVNVASKCATTPDGPSKTYTYTSATAGTLGVKLKSSAIANLYASFRKGCSLSPLEPSKVSDELGCAFGDATPATIPVGAGETVTIVVQSRSYATSTTSFTLELTANP